MTSNPVKQHFYRHLHNQEKPIIPAVDYWKRKLQPEPPFNSNQWKTLETFRSDSEYEI